MGYKLVQMKRSHIPIFTGYVFSDRYFVIPTRKKIGNIPHKGNGKKSEMKIIGFAQFAIVPQNTSHIEKSKRTD